MASRSMVFHIIIAVLVLGTIFSASISVAKQRTMPIGTGGKTGNYYAMGNDIVDYCQEELKDTKINVLSSEGSVSNLLGLTNKKYSVGIVQQDVLSFYSKNNPALINPRTVRVISALHMETVYLLIPKNYSPNTGGSWWEKAKALLDDDNTKPISFESLRGATVSSWGGSVISARALQYFLGVDFNIVDVPPGKRTNINTPIILVGGQPYPPVENLLKTGKFMLVSLDADTVKAKQPFYIKTSVSYNINGKALTVTTVGVRALMVAKVYRSKKRNAPIDSLANCIQDNLADLADDPDTNPNWENVYLLNQQPKAMFGAQ